MYKPQLSYTYGYIKNDLFKKYSTELNYHDNTTRYAMGDFHRQYNDPYKIPLEFYLRLEQKRISDSDSHQSGGGVSFGGIPVYAAHFPSYQEGAAWYDAIVNFFKRPFVRNIGKQIGSQLLSTGGQIAADLSAAQTEKKNGLNVDRVGKIAKRRLAEAGSNLLDYGSQSLKKYKTGGGASGCANWTVRKYRKRKVVRKKRKRVGKQRTKPYKKVRKGRIGKQRRRKKRFQTKAKHPRRRRRRRVTRKRKSSVDDFFNTG
jgi:hypothetical protein